MSSPATRPAARELPQLFPEITRVEVQKQDGRVQGIPPHRLEIFRALRLEGLKGMQGLAQAAVVLEANRLKLQANLVRRRPRCEQALEIPHLDGKSRKRNELR